MIESIRQLLQTYELQSRFISSFLIILGLWIGRLLLLRFVNRRFQEDARAHYNWRKAVEYSSVVIGVVLVGRIWLEGIQSLITYLGILSAGVAIALQDLIVNLAGWAFIIWRRPFAVGDRIQIGEHMGDVIDIRLFEFSMLEIGGGRINAEQSTGRIIHIPNGRIFRDVLANTHQGVPYIWNEIPVLVTFESDWEKAKRVLTQIVNDYAPEISQAAEREARRRGQRFVIAYGQMTPSVYTEVAASGVLITLRYLVPPRQHRNSEQTIWEAILRAFAHHADIDFAYETQREYLHFREKKEQPDEQQAPTIVGKRTLREQGGAHKSE